MSTQQVTAWSTFMKGMASHGISAAAALRGFRKLTVKQMTTPILLSRPCQICGCRGVLHPNPSEWIYVPLIDKRAVITACGHHMAAAIRSYLHSEDVIS